ncbi:hypothetical protein ACOMHN_040365 [Nucella lapillus]
MLDSRPDLRATFADYSLLPNVATRNPFQHHHPTTTTTPFFPNIKTSTFLSPRGHGCSLEGDNSRNQHSGPARLRALGSAVAVSHRDDSRMYRLGSHVVAVPGLPRQSTAAQRLNEKQKQWLSHRFSINQTTFPQLSFSCCGTLDPYHFGQSQDIKTNLSSDSELAVTQHVRTRDSSVVRHNLSSSPPDLSKRTLFQGGHFGGGLAEGWWTPAVVSSGNGQFCPGPSSGSWWKAGRGQVQCWQDRGKRMSVSDDYLLGTSRVSTDCTALSVDTADSRPLSPSNIVTSSPVTAAGQGSTGSLRRAKTQEGASDGKEYYTRTNSENTASVQTLKQGPTPRERSYRQRRIKDSSSKLHPVKSSLMSKRYKNQNRRLLPQQPEKQHEEGSENPQDDQRKTFRCVQCRYMTDRKNNLKRHVVTMHHKAARLLECCATVFHSKASLRDHVTRYHRGGYRCQVCSRNFCRKALLRRHLAVHSGQKDFACQLCGYATSHKSNLERHQRVHARKNPNLGHPLPLHEEEQQPYARFSGGETTDYDDAGDTNTSLGQETMDYDDAGDTNTSLGQASPSNYYQEDSNMPSAGMDTSENQMTSDFSENQRCHVTSSATALHWSDSVKVHSTFADSFNEADLDFLNSREKTEKGCIETSAEETEKSCILTSTAETEKGYILTSTAEKGCIETSAAETEKSCILTSTAETEKGYILTSTAEKCCIETSAAETEKGYILTSTAEKGYILTSTAEKGCILTSATETEKGYILTSAAETEKGCIETSAAETEKGYILTSAAETEKGCILTSAAETEKGSIETSTAEKGCIETSAAKTEKGCILTSTAETEKLHVDVS